MHFSTRFMLPFAGRDEIALGSLFAFWSKGARYIAMRVQQQNRDLALILGTLGDNDGPVPRLEYFNHAFEPDTVARVFNAGLFIEPALLDAEGITDTWEKTGIPSGYLIVLRDRRFAINVRPPGTPPTLFLLAG